ncbi:hypothetical protein ACTQ34_10760 [Agathobaculum sp. LCP25S3_E8]|uniref:hypothetical protein n=1 Tax=Agathobaculum sp. LCP25S3_E8 TaxID=3438735 RepID=UPI003F913701
MRYIARKPCSFGGKKYLIGEDVPADVVLDGKRQVALGTLAAVQDDKTSAILISLGEEQVSLTPEELQRIFDILQAKSEDAVALLQEETRENVCGVIAVCDSRRAVKTAANRSKGEKESTDDSSNEGESEKDNSDANVTVGEGEKEEAGEA